jgi:hypothetical protein
VRAPAPRRVMGVGGAAADGRLGVGDVLTRRERLADAMGFGPEPAGWAASPFDAAAVQRELAARRASDPAPLAADVQRVRADCRPLVRRLYAAAAAAAAMADGADSAGGDDMGDADAGGGCGDGDGDLAGGGGGGAHGSGGGVGEREGEAGGAGAGPRGAGEAGGGDGGDGGRGRAAPLWSADRAPAPTPLEAAEGCGRREASALEAPGDAEALLDALSRMTEAGRLLRRMCGPDP